MTNTQGCRIWLLSFSHFQTLTCHLHCSYQVQYKCSCSRLPTASYSALSVCFSYSCTHNIVHVQMNPPLLHKESNHMYMYSIPIYMCTSICRNICTSLFKYILFLFECTIISFSSYNVLYGHIFISLLSSVAHQQDLCGELFTFLQLLVIINLYTQCSR